MELLINLIVFLGLLATGYFVGIHFEKKHYVDIRRREKPDVCTPDRP